MHVQWNIIRKWKGISTNTCSNRDEPWKLDAKMKEARDKSPHVLWFHLYEMFWLGRSIETESGLEVANRYRNLGRRWWKCSKLTLWSWLHNCVNILKTTGLCTINGWNFRYVSDILRRFEKLMHGIEDSLENTKKGNKIIPLSWLRSCSRNVSVCFLLVYILYTFAYFLMRWYLYPFYFSTLNGCRLFWYLNDHI